MKRQQQSAARSLWWARVPASIPQMRSAWSPRGDSWSATMRQRREGGTLGSDGWRCRPKRVELSRGAVRI